jgi:hypothetical protein
MKAGLFRRAALDVHGRGAIPDNAQYRSGIPHFFRIPLSRE